MTYTRVRRRSGVTRFAGVLLASAIAGAGVVATAGAASAEEPAPVATLETFEASAFADQAADLPPGLVDALDRDLGISAEQYLANAAAARSAAAVVEALEEAGVTVEASQFVAADQSLVVQVDEEHAAAAEAAGAIVGEVKTVPGLDTEKVYDAYEDFKGGYGYGPLDEAGEWQSRCSAGFNGYAADGSPVVLTAGHCAANDVIGSGTELRHVDVDDPIQPEDDQSWGTPGELVGVGGDYKFGGGHDAGLFPVTNDGWSTPATVSTWGNGQGDPRNGEVVVTDHIDPMVGQEVCRSGATSGWTCGETLWVDETLPISLEGGSSEEVTGFITNACAASGDSGGSYLVGSAAVGTLTGGNGPTGPDPEGGPGEVPLNCDEWDPMQADNTGAHVTIVYAISGSDTSSEAYYGDDWELAVDVATPKVTAPKPGAEVSQSPTFTGTVADAGTHHVARVSIDGTTYKAQVKADGSFAVKVTDVLEPGEYAATVRVGYGAHSRSEAVEVAFTVIETPVADLVVEGPTDGLTTSNPRSAFNGTGEPGATITLSIDGDTYGETEVAKDGTWLLTPSKDLPMGERFDATITQVADDDTQEKVIADLGVRMPKVTITTPADGSEVAGDVILTGTSYAGADVTLTIADGPEGEITVDEDGAWTFTPAEELAAGSYTATATASTEGGDERLTTSQAEVTFTVAEGADTGDAGGDDDADLPDTGSNTTGLIIGGIALLAAGGAAVAIRARRNNA